MNEAIWALLGAIVGAVSVGFFVCLRMIMTLEHTREMYQLHGFIAPYEHKETVKQLDTLDELRQRVEDAEKSIRDSQTRKE